jgi:hypothetical protein
MIAWAKPTIPITQPPATASRTTIANSISVMGDASAVRYGASNRFTNQSSEHRNPSLSLNRLSGILCESQPPGAGESGVASAAEGATGPRKRSGKKDRGGIRDLWKAGRRAIRLPHRRGKGRRKAL